MEALLAYLVANPAVTAALIAMVADVIRGAAPNTWKLCKGKGITLPLVIRALEFMAATTRGVAEYGDSKKPKDKENIS